MSTVRINDKIKKEVTPILDDLGLSLGEAINIYLHQIKLNNGNYFISVYTYSNNKMRLRYESLIESHDITLNIDNVCLDKNKVCLDPSIKDNGL